MAITSLIIGESGTGKTSSLRNFNPSDVKIIQCFAKPLPFRNKGYEVIFCENYIKVINEMLNTEKDIIVIDDITYLMTIEFMNRLTEKSFEKFNDIANSIWQLVNNAIYKVPNNKRVYIIGHTDNSTEISRLKTLGKLLDDKVNVEGMVTIVFRTCIRNKQYCFSTSNNGADTVKTPFNMFEDKFIDNDLKLIDENIKEYYNIKDVSESEVKNDKNDNNNNNIHMDNKKTSENIKRRVVKRKSPDLSTLTFPISDKEEIPFDEV